MLSHKTKVLLLSLFVFPFVALAAEPKAMNVVLIGWDGAQREHVKECIERGELPNLMRVANEGALVAIDVTEKTDTKAGWAQILTGYSSNINGVTSNADFKPIPEGFTIFERLENELGKDRIKTLAVIGKSGNVGNAAPGYINKKRAQITEDTKTLKKDPAQKPSNQKEGNRPQQVARKRVKNSTDEAETPRRQQQRQARGERQGIGKEVRRKHQGEPYYLTSKKMDYFQNGLMENEKVGEKVLSLLEENKDQQFFLFVHFAEPDHSGHKHGENSQEYTDALKKDDLWTGKILDKLNDLGLKENTLVYITADHGFDEGMKGHKNAPTVFLATSDKKVASRGNRADITPTILDGLGFDLSKIQPPLTGKSLRTPGDQPVW